MNEDSVMDLGKRISLCELFLLKNWDRRKHLTEKDFSLDMKCLYVFDMVIPVSDVIVDMVEDCPVGTYEEYYYKFLLYNTIPCYRDYVSEMRSCGIASRVVRFFKRITCFFKFNGKLI